MISIDNVEDEIIDQIKELCKNKKYNDAIDIIISNNINVNDYYFLCSICEYNDEQLLKIFNDVLHVDFTQNNYEILQSFAFYGKIDILDKLITLHNCYNKFIAKSQYPTLQNNKKTIEYVNNQQICH